MVPKREQQRMRRLLSEAINVLCKASLPFKAKFTVEGLLGITLDDEEILLINVDEVVELPGETSHTTANEKSSTSTSVSSEFERPSRPSSTLSNAATVPAQSPTLLKRANTDNDHGFPSKRHRPRGSSMADSIVIKEEPGSDSEDSNSAQTNANDIPTKPISRIFTSKSRTSSTPIKKEKIDKPNQNCDQPSNASSQGFGVGELSFSSEMSLSEVTSMEMAGGDGAEWSADAWASDSQSQLGPSMSQPVAIGSIKMEHPTQPDPGGSNQDVTVDRDDRTSSCGGKVKRSGGDPSSSYADYPVQGQFNWKYGGGGTTRAMYPAVPSGGDDRNEVSALGSLYIPIIPGQKFSSDGQMLVNETSPDDRSHFKCRLCKVLFSCYDEIAEHCRMLHDDHPFICEKCGKCYGTMAAHRSHLREHERRYQCSFCCRRFAKSTHCRVHTRLHTGETPFKCERCGARFKASAGLWYHRNKNKCSHIKTEIKESDDI